MQHRATGARLIPPRNRTFARFSCVCRAKLAHAIIGVVGGIGIGLLASTPAVGTGNRDECQHRDGDSVKAAGHPTVNRVELFPQGACCSSSSRANLPTHAARSPHRERHSGRLSRVHSGRLDRRNLRRSARPRSSWHRAVANHIMPPSCDKLRVEKWNGAIPLL